MHPLSPPLKHSCRVCRWEMSVVCELEDSIPLKVVLDLPHPNAPSILTDDVAALVDKPLGMRCLEEYVHKFGPPPPSDMLDATW